MLPHFFRLLTINSELQVYEALTGVATDGDLNIPESTTFTLTGVDNFIPGSTLPASIEIMELLFQLTLAQIPFSRLLKLPLHS